MGVSPLSCIQDEERVLPASGPLPGEFPKFCCVARRHTSRRHTSKMRTQEPPTVALQWDCWYWNRYWRPAEIALEVDTCSARHGKTSDTIKESTHLHFSISSSCTSLLANGQPHQLEDTPCDSAGPPVRALGCHGDAGDVIQCSPSPLIPKCLY